MFFKPIPDWLAPRLVLASRFLTFSVEQPHKKIPKRVPMCKRVPLGQSFKYFTNLYIKVYTTLVVKNCVKS